MSDLLMQMKNNKPSVGLSQPSAPVDDSLIKDLEMRLNELSGDYYPFKKDVLRWLKDLQDQLNNKADIEALNNLEKALMDKLNEIVKALQKQFADKNDTKKALKLLEKQLKNLYDLIMSKQNGPDEDDAMFSKKPLGGFSCASCEKNLINLQGQAADFHTWQKFPYRDPAERIARVGQGFSRMLSMIKPESINRYGQSQKGS